MACPLDALCAPAVVDSWLVAEGRVRGLPLHEDRFRRSCLDLRLDLALIDHFLADVRRMLPRQGRWFPRVEATREGELALWLRAAPQAPGETSLWIPPHPDRRRHPMVKGPDLAYLAELRAEAQVAGAQDALLHAADGTVLEAAHAALVWWRDGVLCLPAPDLPLLPSITRLLLEALAAGLAIPVREEICQVTELPHLECWTANALYGLRPVTVWSMSGRTIPGSPSSLGYSLQHALSQAAVPVDS